MREECKDCNKSLEDCACIEDTIEFTEADIETFTDWIFNPAEPNQALKDAAERYQERMYSEEEVIKILYQFHYDLVNSNFDTKEEWFNEFKNK
jgi:hypothetical protein